MDVFPGAKTDAQVLETTHSSCAMFPCFRITLLFATVFAWMGIARVSSWPFADDLTQEDIEQ